MLMLRYIGMVAAYDDVETPQVDSSVLVVSGSD
jgi:hypothetical protein